MKKFSHQQIFLFVYVMISLATLYHSSFGFGTLHGMPTDLEGTDLFIWWFLGFICATAIDVGMGAVVWAMINGYRNRYLILSLLILAIFSAYSQLVYSAYHSSDMVAITENASLKPFMQTVLDIRIIILPLCLPFFSLFYGFVAKNAPSEIEVEKELEDLGVKQKPKGVVHLRREADGKISSVCGISNPNFHSDSLNEITCKNCSMIISKSSSLIEH